MNNAENREIIDVDKRVEKSTVPKNKRREKKPPINEREFKNLVLKNRTVDSEKRPFDDYFP